MSDPLLQVQDVTLKFGGVTALDGVSFDVRQGEMFAIIGPNGAGKSSLINVLTGIYHATSGKVRFAGQDVTDRSPAAIARAGAVRTFQNLGLFERMSVLDNVLVGRHGHSGGGIVAGMFRWPAAMRLERQATEHCRAVLDLLGLSSVADSPVGVLPYGTKKRVEFAKALAAEPQLIMLDEPVAGLNTEESERLAQIIVQTRSEFGATVVVIEHNVEMVMSMADRVMVLDFGRRIAIGDPSTVRTDPRVVAAYIGEQADERSELA